MLQLYSPPIDEGHLGVAPQSADALQLDFHVGSAHLSG